MWRRRQEIPASELHRGNPVRFAIVLLVIVVIAVYFGFTKHIPFKHGFRLKAEFATAVNIHSKSPVRIAGVDVGKVTGIKREGNTGLVRMEIESSGLPIHSDATLKIRPRIFLEGNWFVELQPGSPSAKTLSSGATLPITQTSDPVQLDQVLDALNTDTRANLQNFLIGYGDGLTRKPDAAENAEQDPIVRGLTRRAGAQQGLPARALGRCAATRSSARRSAGTEPHDLSDLVASIGKVTAALNVHEQQLGELIGNFDTFFHSFASQSSSLSATVAELPSSLRNIDRGLAALDAAFPSMRTFATRHPPGRQSDARRRSRRRCPGSSRWRRRSRRLSSAASPRGSSKRRRRWRALTSEQTPFYQQTELFNKCLTKVVYTGRQHQAAGRLEHLGRRRLQGVLVRLGRARRDRSELRRQRHDAALPARQRRADDPLGAHVDPGLRT